MTARRNATAAAATTSPEPHWAVVIRARRRYADAPQPVSMRSVNHAFPAAFVRNVALESGRGHESKMGELRFPVRVDHERRLVRLRGGARSRSLRGRRRHGRAAAAARGSGWGGADTRVRLVPRLLELGGRPARMGSGLMACSPPRLSLGGPCVGEARRRVAHASRTLGARLADHQRAGQLTPA
jgi:hypothetical protein